MQSLEFLGSFTRARLEPSRDLGGSLVADLSANLSGDLGLKRGPVPRRRPAAQGPASLSAGLGDIAAAGLGGIGDMSAATSESPRVAEGPPAILLPVVLPRAVRRLSERAVATGLISNTVAAAELAVLSAGLVQVRQRR